MKDRERFTTGHVTKGMPMRSKPGRKPGHASVLILLATAAPLWANLQMTGLLNHFQLYGREWIHFKGNARTSIGGDVGSNKEVTFTSKNNKINGNLTSGGTISVQDSTVVTGALNAAGDVTFQGAGSLVSKSTNVGGHLTIGGATPENNVFADSMYIGNAPISVARSTAQNTFAGTVIAGNVDNSNRPPLVRFGSNAPFPSNNLQLMDTVVNFDGSVDCTTPVNAKFNMSMCGLGGSASDSILPPGRYGDWVISPGNTIYLSSGLYHFHTLKFKTDKTKMLFIQPGNSLTKVIVRTDFIVEPGNIVIAPLGYFKPGFKQGTVLLYCGCATVMSDGNQVCATVMAPATDVTLPPRLHLHGQVFGRTIDVADGFDVEPGMGSFLPMQMPPPFDYSVIHYHYKPN